MCFFDNRCDQNWTVVKTDLAWWMEAAPPRIIFPEKPSTSSPILETILEERETEQDDQEHDTII
ncbi:unnamed protein product [Eruca vesicaria subsp. sativa]|uniref:Uncharacterized protein n=1 Tax=Eruca vesicaria subsp. sativa TaxID=29727 RepID=A0ABC8J4C3_ERUVS|nr:unnamed protein product [Eruca vesicaria subsp. sativa]